MSLIANDLYAEVKKKKPSEHTQRSLLSSAGKPEMAGQIAMKTHPGCTEQEAVIVGLHR